MPPSRPVLAIPATDPAALLLLAGRAVRFAGAGLVGLLVDLTAFSLAHAAGLPDAAARAASIAVATAVTWQINRHLTFAAGHVPPAGQAVRYAMVAGASQGLNLSIFLMLRTVFPTLPAPLGIALSGALAAAFSFAGQSLFTFPGRRAASVRPDRTGQP